MSKKRRPDPMANRKKDAKRKTQKTSSESTDIADQAVPPTPVEMSPEETMLWYTLLPIVGLGFSVVSWHSTVVNLTVHYPGNYSPELIWGHIPAMIAGGIFGLAFAGRVFDLRRTSISANLDAKRMHGALTAWLVLCILGNFFVGLSLLSTSSPWLSILAIVNVVCFSALFQWKKWGFYGCVAMSLITFVINAGNGETIADATGAMSGLIGIAILYGLLQLGKPKSGWEQLE